MIHEILYLDMELESYNQQDQQEVTDLGVSIPNNNHDQRESDDSGVKFARTLDPISILTEDNTTSGISTNSTVYTTALSCLKDNLSVNTSNSKSVMARESFPNDILTDDEKENER